jgi:hypothetical protein
MAQSTKAPRKSMAPTTRAIGFSMFFAAGIATLAAIVILPEYMDLRNLQLQRDIMAHQLACDQKLNTYYDRLINDSQSSMELATRILMRQGNYRLTGFMELPLGPDRPLSLVPAKLQQEAQQLPPPRHDELYRVGQWLDDGPTRLGLLALSLSCLMAAMLLFGPAPRRTEEQPAGA